MLQICKRCQLLPPTCVLCEDLVIVSKHDVGTHANATGLTVSQRSWQAPDTLPFREWHMQQD